MCAQGDLGVFEFVSLSDAAAIDPIVLVDQRQQLAVLQRQPKPPSVGKKVNYVGALLGGPIVY